jgi:hypothetical protein
MSAKEASVKKVIRRLGRHLDKNLPAYLGVTGTGASVVGAHASVRSAVARERQAELQEKKAFWEGFEKEAAVFNLKHGDAASVAGTIKRLSNFKPKSKHVGG